MTVAFRGAMVTPIQSDRGGVRWFDDVVMTIDDGRIRSIVDAAEVAPPELDRAVDLRPSVMLPGFVDAHLHFPQTRIVGSAAGPLLEWLDTAVFPEESRFAQGAYAEEVCEEFLGYCLKNGTTAVGAFSSSHAEATEVLLAALRRRGMRGIAGLTLMDQNCPAALRCPAETAIAALGELADRFDDPERAFRVAVTPRFAISCSRDLLERAGRLAADRELPVQTHISENPAENTATLGVHPFADDYLGVYEAVGLIGPRTVLAHAIHLSRSEWERVASAGASIAHCPDSNFFLGSGRMPIDRARELGVRVGLGTDVAAGRSFDLRRTAAYAYDNALCVEAQLEPADLLRMATLGGAEVLHLEDRIGSLEVGKLADFVVVTPAPYARELPRFLGHLLFASDAVPVERVYLGGELAFGGDSAPAPSSSASRRA